MHAQVISWTQSHTKLIKHVWLHRCIDVSKTWTSFSSHFFYKFIIILKRKKENNLMRHCDWGVAWQTSHIYIHTSHNICKMWMFTHTAHKICELIDRPHVYSYDLIKSWCVKVINLMAWIIISNYPEKPLTMIENMDLQFIWPLYLTA